ncbi:MAG: PAS domain-containing protein, partial [Candidatus Cloacimonetes bacterium]|nr:PAS domain-containing protein [Candidatus Cloacimonadota bacterium]
MSQQNNESNSELAKLKKAVKELEQQNKELLDSQQLYKDLFNNTPVGISIRETDGRLISANKRWQEIFNVSD